jgi:ABC-2 type transport system ATP-binding protein
VLRIRNLTKKFPAAIAVDDVSFKVRPGEIFALIGPNGSGKTTIIKIIAGLLKPTSGMVTVGGLDVTREPVRTKAQIGYIPDDPAVWPAMTGEEFLQFVAALYGVDEGTRRARVPRLLSVFDLKGTEKGYFEDYSRGNKQKFAILAALIHEPKLLLVDEPIVGLDPRAAEIAKSQLVQFARQGGAVLLATHTLSVAQEIATEIGILAAGKLVASAGFKELRTRAGLDETASLEDVYLALTRR